MPRRNSGFTLLETLAAGSILITMSTVALVMLNTMNKDLIFSRQQGDRDILYQKLLKNAGDPNNIASSLPFNTVPTNSLSACLTGDNAAPGANDCTGDGVTYYDAVLYTDPVTQVTGTQASPLYYNKQGEKCTSPDPALCPFKIYSKFQARCPGGTSSCKKAESIEVTVFLEPVTLPNGRIPAGMPVKRAQTKARLLTSESVDNLTVKFCPLGQQVMKVNGDGSVVCRQATYPCPTGKVVLSVDANGTVTCGYPQNTQRVCTDPGTTLSSVVYQDGSLGTSVCSRTVGGPDPAYPDSKGCPWGMRLGGFTADNQMLCYGEWGSYSCPAYQALNRVTYDSVAHDVSWNSLIIQGGCKAIPNASASAMVQNCGANKAIRKINFDTMGNITSIECTDLDICGAGYVLRGFDSAGNKICRRFTKGFGGGFTVQKVYLNKQVRANYQGTVVDRKWNDRYWGGAICNQGNPLAVVGQIQTWRNPLPCYRDILGGTCSNFSDPAGGYTIYNDNCDTFGDEYALKEGSWPCACPSWAPNAQLLREFTMAGCGLYSRDERYTIQGGACNGQPYFAKGDFDCQVTSYICTE